MTIWNRSIRVTPTATAAESVSVRTTSRTTRCYVCANVPGPSSTFTSCVWKTGSPITSPNVRMSTANSTPTKRPTVSCANTCCPTSSNTTAGRTRFWTLPPSSRHMLSLSIARCKMDGRSSTSTLSRCPATRRSSSAGTTPHKSSWRTSASVGHIARWSTSMACCCWGIKSPSSGPWSNSRRWSSSAQRLDCSCSSTPSSFSCTTTARSRRVVARQTLIDWCIKAAMNYPKASLIVKITPTREICIMNIMSQHICTLWTGRVTALSVNRIIRGIIAVAVVRSNRHWTWTRV